MILNIVFLIGIFLVSAYGIFMIGAYFKDKDILAGHFYLVALGISMIAAKFIF